MSVINIDGVIKKLQEIGFKKLIQYIVWGFFAILLSVQIPYWLGNIVTVIHTDYSADNILDFIGGYLSFIGTVILGIITVYLSKKSNDINDRLVLLEEKAKMPIVKMIEINLSDCSKSMYIDKKSLYYRLDNQVIKTNSDTPNSHLHYDYSIEIKLCNISDNTLCDLLVSEAELISIDSTPLFLGDQTIKENTHNIIKSDSDVSIRFNVTKEFFYEFYGGKYRSIKLTIIYNDIFGVNYEECLYFGLAYRNIGEYVEGIIPPAFESKYTVKQKG